MRASFLCLLCGFADSSGSLSERSAPVSVTFDESLIGFGVEGGSEDDTIDDFEAAYEQGKLLNKTLSFSVHVDVSDMWGFVRDEMHTGAITGKAISDDITGAGGAVLGDDALIHIFQHDVQPTHELGMQYILPFRDAQGKNYSLTGIKHIPGNDCLRLLEHITTLYVHVRDMDTPAPHRIIRKGMVKIDLPGALSLIASLRLKGGSWPLKPAQELNGLLLFVAFLGKDLVQNCFTKGAFENDFTYIWSSDGDNGALLDMIRRPDAIELRLASFARGSRPLVRRQFFDMSEFKSDGDTLTLGTVTLSKSRCNGTIADLAVDIGFDDLNGHSREMVFLPELFRHGPGKVVGGLVPLVTSRYGTITADPSRPSSVGNISLKRGTPLVKTTYAIPAGLEMLRWGMVSASQFNNTDLQIELVVSPIVSNSIGYIAVSYARFEDEEYHLNSLVDLVAAVKVKNAGNYDNSQTHRLFDAEIKLGRVHIDLSCSAPVEQFAFLDKEGDTYIHTSLFGDCRASVSKPHSDNVIYTSKGVNLIEVKGTAPAASVAPGGFVI